MNRDTFRQSIVVLAAIVTVVFNGLANALPLNGQNTGEISDRFKVFFVPAGYVFAIWGLIYIGMFTFAIYQALPSQKENPRLRSVGSWFILASIANIVWLYLWHYNYFVWTLVAMLTLLFSLVAIYLRLDIGRSDVTRGELWLVHIPISLYLGWVSVATIANVTDVLYYLGWGGGGIAPQIWAVIMIIAGLVIATLVSLRRGDYIFPLVFVWAYAGIAVKQAGSSVVSVSAWIGAGLALILLLVAIYKERSQMRMAKA
jgi:hypothetical protein